MSINVKLLGAGEIKKVAPVTSMTIWRWVQEGKFPAPVKVGRRSFWRSDEINAWVDGLSTGQDTSAQATVAAAAAIANSDAAAAAASH